MTDIAVRVESLSKQYRIGGPQVKFESPISNLKIGFFDE
jgi:hypothetical protein